MATEGSDCAGSHEGAAFAWEGVHACEYGHAAPPDGGEDADSGPLREPEQRPWRGSMPKGGSTQLTTDRFRSSSTLCAVILGGRASGLRADLVPDGLREQVDDVVTVAAGQRHHEQDALAVGDDVVLAVRACVVDDRPGTAFGPRRPARTWGGVPPAKQGGESITARNQYSWFFDRRCSAAGAAGRHSRPPSPLRAPRPQAPRPRCDGGSPWVARSPR